MQHLFEQSSLPDSSGSDLELADEQSCTDEEENEVGVTNLIIINSFLTIVIRYTSDLMPQIA
jgi:hypothetical protein